MGQKGVCQGLATGGCGSCCQGTGLPLCRASLGPDFLLGGPREPTPVSCKGSCTVPMACLKTGPGGLSEALLLCQTAPGLESGLKA